MGRTNSFMERSLLRRNSFSERSASSLFMSRRKSSFVSTRPQQLWKLCRLAVSHGLLQGQLLRAKARRTAARFNENGVPKRTVCFVSNDSQLAATPYWAQGDAQFYSQDQIERRFLLRREAGVEEALHQWWQAALRSAKSGGDETACVISHERYVQLGMAIYRQLVPGKVTSNAYLSEARAAAEKDWVRDRKGRPHLVRSTFTDAMFELADHYVASVDAAAYATFLRHLLQQVSISPAGEPVLLWRERPFNQLKRPATTDLPPRATTPATSPKRAPTPASSPKRASGGGMRGSKAMSSSRSSARLRKLDGFEPVTPSPPRKKPLPAIGAASSHDNSSMWPLPPRW